MKLSEWLKENPDFDHDVELEDGDVVSDMLSLWRIVRIDDMSSDCLVIGAPDHTTGIMQYGIVCAAKLQLEDWMRHGDGED